MPRRRLVVSAAVAALATGALAASGDYSFDLPLAAVSPAGDFPIHVEAGAFVADGTAHLALDAAGALTGAADFPGVTLDLSGTFAAANGVETIKLSSPGKKGARFAGKLAGATFAGSFADGGALTIGSGTFTIDVATARPLTASFAFSVRGGFGARRRGRGTITSSDGVAAELAADVTPGATSKLNAKGGGASLKARGRFAESASAFTAWSCKAFGATARGAGEIGVGYGARPDVALVAVNGDPLEAKDSPDEIDLSLDAVPYLKAAFEKRGLETTTAVFDDADAAYAGLLAKMGEIRDADVLGAAYPTRVVVIGLGHGAVWAHGAVKATPDLPVTVLVDFDGSSCGWLAAGHGPVPDVGDPATAYGISPFDLKDIVEPNTTTGLEIRSTTKCPDALAGGADVAYDENENRRSSGRVDQLFVARSVDSHAKIHAKGGKAMPVVAAFLVERLTK